MINIIVACDINGGIGKDGKMPWHLPEDLKHFKNLTKMQVVIMGRKTYESIGKSLPMRTNVVITRDKDYLSKTDGECFVSDNVYDVIDKFSKNTTSEIFIIGGAELIRQTEHFADKLYLTHIYHNFNCDTFVEFKTDWKFKSNKRGKMDEENPYEYYFQTWIRG